MYESINRNNSIDIIVNDRNISIFAISGAIKCSMKYSELHRLILKNGWIIIRQTGSHVIYQKGEMHYPVPNHGSDEVKKGLEIKIRKMMGLK